VHAVDGREGRLYPLRSDLAQGLWVALLLVTGLGALRARAPSRDVLLLGLTVLGITAFTLIFQGRSRYLLTFVPLVVALGAMVRQRPRRLSTSPAVTRSSRSEPARL
jgi:CHASE2 domain-containing sensor protein